jgi:putative mRNA 3-end processing factor
MRIRARARQHGVALPLVISDHADWDGLTATIAATGAGEIWVTHGQEDALVHWCATNGLKARPLDIVGYGDEDDENPSPLAGEGGEGDREATLNRSTHRQDPSPSPQGGGEERGEAEE